VNALALNTENYFDAIALLKKWLDCPRHIASCHSLAIINYPKITKESPTALRQLINTVRRNLYALSNLEEPTNANAITLSLISSKLPANIRKQWELTLTNKEVP
jgi:hypothetical protein